MRTAAMQQDFIDFLNRYGLPGWTVIVIGAGTIVASLIGALNAWSVAWFNVRASRLLEASTANREHRLAASKPTLEYARTVLPLVGLLRQATLSGPGEVHRWTGQSLPELQHEWALGRLRDLVDINRLYFNPDPDVRRAHWLLVFTRDTLAAALERGADKAEVAEAVEGMLTAISAVEWAVEGYVFRIPSSSRKSRLRVRVFRLKRRVAQVLNRLFRRSP
jgi:hypothetical protein